MARERLTSKSRRAEDNKIPFPGTVGNEDRLTTPVDKYDTFEHTVNHELPDKRTEWKQNPRDEIGFGIPKVAAMFATAHKAVRLSIAFLGDKADDKMIEAQARDFLRLGSARIDSSLKRFADSEDLYKVEAGEMPEFIQKKIDEKKEKEEGAEDKDACKASAVVAEAPKTEAVKVETAKVEATAAPVATTVVAEPVKIETAKVEVKADQNAAPVVSNPEAKLDEQKKDQLLATAEENTVEAEAVESAIDTTDELGTLDVELLGPDVVAHELTAADEEELDGMFNDEDDSDVEASVKKPAKKAGIKTLGGQPSLTTTKTASGEDLASLWKDAPDVSEAFA